MNVEWNFDVIFTMLNRRKSGVGPWKYMVMKGHMHRIVAHLTGCFGIRKTSGTIIPETILISYMHLNELKVYLPRLWFQAILCLCDT